MDRPAHHRFDIDEDLPVPRVRPGDPAGDAACGGLAKPCDRPAAALALPLLERPRPPWPTLSTAAPRRPIAPPAPPRRPHRAESALQAGFSAVNSTVTELSVRLARWAGADGGRPVPQPASRSAIQASTSSADRGRAAVRLWQPSGVTTTSSSMRTPMPRNSSGTVRSSVWKYRPGSTVSA